LLVLRVLATLGGFRSHGIFLLVGMNGIHVDHSVLSIKLVLPGDSECHLSLDWYLNNEYGTLIQLTHNRDLPTHQADKLVRDPQTEAGPSVLGLDAFICLRKGFEELFNSLLGNTYSSVYDFDDKVPLDVCSNRFLNTLDINLG
jgi:hypothetical protein